MYTQKFGGPKMALGVHHSILFQQSMGRVRKLPPPKDIDSKSFRNSNFFHFLAVETGEISPEVPAPGYYNVKQKANNSCLVPIIGI